MPFVETRFISPTTLTTSAASALYTVPTGYSAIIKQLVVTNITGTAATFTFYIGAATVGNALFSGTSVAANDTVIINLSQVLSTGEVLRALASTGSSLNLTVSGVINDGPLASTATYIPDNAITTPKIADASITTAKIAAGAVATVDLADASVSQIKIANNGSLIMRFASSIIRDLSFGGVGQPVLAEGMTCYLDDTNVLQTYTGSAWVEIASTDSKTPRGVVALTYSTTGSGSIGPSETVTLTTPSFTAVANRYYKITYYEPVLQSNTVAGYLTAKIRLTNISGTVYQLLDIEPVVYSSTDGQTVLAIAITTLPAGATVFCGTMASNTGSFLCVGNSSVRRHIIVEDIGSSL